MIQLGKYNTLEVVKAVDFGLYLDGGEKGEILLPTRYVPENAEPGDQLEVFIYLDSEDRIIATTETPLAQVGEFALLEVVAINRFGAFLNWGLMKDLMVPYSEQRQSFEVGEKHLVYVYEDEQTNRIVATSKTDKFLDKSPVEYQMGDEVDAFIVYKNTLGYRALVNEHVWGMLYHDEVYRPIDRGEKIKAYVKKLREDNKLDLTLQKPGYEAVEDFSDVLLKYIKAHDGKINITDKSDAELIRKTFNVSKKVFKKAVGKLYKNKEIQINDESIELTEK
ncbi:MAG: S1-like domain-containing RNA-binding protein [Salinivirgaceae bacterium]|jgi:predicted RNA-binding protein (virulence factor B family)|nr:S1-like domain-containing RNA-binding protein [Salinivirgaceae bacterium]